MRGVRVSLSSGDVFYVDATLDEVMAALSARRFNPIGGRFVNAAQVAQLVASDIPSVEIPETLEVPE